MKKTIILLATIIISAAAWAQSPEKMSYQAVIRNAANELVTSKPIGIQISILQGISTGTPVYVETQTPNSNQSGLISLEIGTGNITSGDLTTINWANGPYFIKTETDPVGGTNYTITGTSQLMSVPYALHAKSAESISGGITEIDPVFGASVAKSIQTLDISNWNAHTIDTDTHIDSAGVAALGYVAGQHTVDTDTQIDSTGITTLGFVSGAHTIDTDTHIDSVGVAALGYVAGQHTVDTDTQIDSTGIATLGFVAGALTVETDPSIPSGNVPGQMLYWNDTAWVTVASGTEGQSLSFCNGVPTWGPCLIQGTNAYPVTNLVTGRIWMDRNLGATQVATSSTDTASYGNLYQWGRGSDGHQIPTSNTTSTLSNSDSAGHGDFILAPNTPFNWRSPQNTNLWQGENGVNNPCPTGYRLPTEAELNAERLSWGSNNSAGAYASPLKLTLVGYRAGSNGTINSSSISGYYWSSTPYTISARLLTFNNSGASINQSSSSDGFPIRCIKD